MSTRLIVFTDLDGTLLSHDDYDFEPARPALEILRRLGAVVVLARSKTRAEIEALRARIGLDGPFVSENGGALWVPSAQVPAPIEGAVEVDGYQCVAFGTPYDHLREALAEMSGRLGVELRGFGDMTVAEIASLTGLPDDEAALARRREHDEPFVPARELTADDATVLATMARARKLTVTRGGRFHHLTGRNDKGQAARRLIDAWATRGAVRSLGLGDGPNDLELLVACEYAVVVARPDGTHAPELVAALPNAVRTRSPGPEGFTEGVRTLLGDSEG